jgi:hypothetical protein
LKLQVISVETKNQSEIVLYASGEDVTLHVHSIYTRSIEDDIVTTILNKIPQSLAISETRLMVAYNRSTI